ncbi:MAG: adenylosuccinate synthetase [Nakamurella sp.]
MGRPVMVPRGGRVPNDRHIIVVGLGFGDEGKGATVDALCAAGGTSAVVRFNGGAQAAHNVVADGVHHTFAQFGSGTLTGTPTYLSDRMLVEPIALAAEAEDLEHKGVPDPLALLTVHPDALLTTPVHVAANRTREDLRGGGRHGSCGRGIGETTWYDLAWQSRARPGDQVGNLSSPGRATEPPLRVGDCREPLVLRRKLDALQQFYQPLLSLGDHRVPSVDAMTAMYREFAGAVRMADDGYLGGLADSGRLIFEGAQGVLLDEWRGFHPYTTWSTTTPANARALLAGLGQPAGYVLGVLRSYQTRHGAGPLPSETVDTAMMTPERHNDTGTYQGGWRVGHLDPVALRYAIAACQGVDGLAVTHLDTTGTGQFVEEYCYGGHRVRRLPLGAARDLTHQGRLTTLTQSCTTVLGRLPTRQDELADRIEGMLGVPVVHTADGPDRKNRT